MAKKLLLNPKFNLVLVFLLLLFPIVSFSQTTIKSQSFDVGASGYSDDLNYTISVVSLSTITNSSSESSPNSLRFHGDSSTENVLTFDDVDLSGYSNVKVSLSFSSYDVESSEDLRFYISYDGGINYNYTKLIDGDNPGDTVDWGDSDPNDAGFPANPFIVNVPNTESTVRIQVRADSDLDSGDYFYIDNVIIEGVSLIPEPEIDIIGNGNSIVSGDSTPSYSDHTQFLSAAIGTPETHTFTIDNTAGTAVLNISSITSDDTEFAIASITTPTTVAIGATTTFDVIYTPTVVGPNTATITINNNDPDPSEATYTFQVEGAVLVSSVGSVGPDGEWKYLDDGSNQGTTWQGIGYDDSTWASGNATLGYGPDGYIDTNIGQPSTPRPITTYFRKTFIADATDVAFSIMDLSAIRDDGMVVYLNGVEVWRDNMPSGTISYNTEASGIVGGSSDPYLEGEWINTSLANALVLGVNVLAVEIHQIDDTSSDIGFNFDLQLRNDTIFTAGGLWFYEDDGSDQGTAWQTDTALYSTWTSGNAELGFSPSNEDGATTVVADNDQITTYFRKSFEITATETAFDYMRLNALFDDGIVVYIDGNEVWRNNMPTGAIAYNTLASGSIAVEDEWKNILLSNYLTVGTHEIAVEVHNRLANHEDIRFDLFIDFINDSGINTPGGTWFYLDDGSDQGTAWQTDTSLYNSWSGGNAQLGYSEGEEADEVTLVSYGDDVNDKHETTYFRRQFDVSAAQAAFSALELNALIDDGMVVYIDGVEVWRNNMPSGAINYTTFASGDAAENVWMSSEIANTLTAGTHEIAIEVHQVNLTSSDISFDFYLDFNNYLIGSSGSWHFLDDGTDQGTAWQTDTVLFSTWASGNSELGFGDGDETTTVSDLNNQITTYFRKQVNVSGADVTNSTLVLQAVRDAGMVVYINGVEIWRDNMPIGVLDYTSLARSEPSGSEERTWITYRLNNVLTSGINEIAVEVHHSSSDTNDQSFNFRMFTDNSFVFVPPGQPDYDGDLIVDYKDVDDDNDGISDILEGCLFADLESLNSSGSGEDIESDFPLNIALLDGNNLNFTKTGTYEEIESYDAGDHGWTIRVRGPNTSGTISMTFDTAVDNLVFKLIDFDENETWTVNAYDDSNNLINLTITGKVYHLGSYIDQVGNTFSDVNNGLATNNNGEDEISDAYGTAYFYFPGINIKKVDFIISQPIGSSIRLGGITYCDIDTDGDGIENYQDSDSDNDGIPDLVEAGGSDADGNGIIDTFVDDDQDGLADIVDSSTSYNTDETSVLEPFLDFDGDGIINSLDLDSDNDGIVDLIEAGELDTNGDGQIDGFTDGNNDGYHDTFDGAGSILITGGDSNTDGLADDYPNANQDLNGFPNFLDLDSDDDGISDNIEAQATNLFTIYSSNNNGDTDGIPNIFDGINGFGGQGLIPVDTDFDCIPDYLDTNSDDDLEDDVIEGHDTNGDGTVDGSDSPSANTGLFTNIDSDGDGLDDGFDNNDAGFDASNGGLGPNSHPQFDGGYDRDWRYTASPIIFDGIDDHVDFGNQHDVSGSFSLEAWVNQQATKTPGTILSKRDIKSGNLRGYHLVIDNNNYPNLTWYNNSGTEIINITSAHAIANNKWYHIAATFNGSVAKIYLNGVEVATGNTTLGPSTGSEKFMVGAMYDSDFPCTGGYNHFEGYIDEIRLWNVALNVDQIREMMNQEIVNNGGSVRGSIVPLNISIGLSWNSLNGYYPMNNDRIDDQSNYDRNGIPRFINAIQPQTAPLPYTTVRDDGSWEDNTVSTPWTYGDSVWSLPNATELDIAGNPIDIDWNIVQLSHNISSGNKDITVLGLISDTANKTLTIAEPSESLDEHNDGQSLRITHYLELDGIIDLVGESQLLQDPESILDRDSGGYLERDQQGTANSFNYNYWSSSVGTITPSGVGQRGMGLPNISNSFSVNNQIFDGRNTTTPAAITDFGTSPHYANTAPASTAPLKVSSYWLWAFNGPSDFYDAWIKIDENTQLSPGEGYTMKGSLGDVTVITNQNYTFRGKPNNGDINLSLTAGNDRLVGNPYPSAIDVVKFIEDNTRVADGGNNTVNVFNGAVYFWDHFGEEDSHNLREYVGGYATRNKLTGAPAISNDMRINANGATATKIPGQHIPVNQGFFVNTLPTAIPISGTNSIIFKNSQRIFSRESSGNSTFMKPSKKSNLSLKTNSKVETYSETPIIRLMFNSPKGYHRQIAIGTTENASNEYDFGYDAFMPDVGIEDMYWVLNDSKFVIQGVNNFNKNQEFPLGIIIEESGLISIEIDVLENIEPGFELYIKDNLVGSTHNINDTPYEINLEAGEYLNRFSLVFKSSNTLSIDDNTLLNSIYINMNNSTSELEIKKLAVTKIESVRVFNILGQQIMNWSGIFQEREYSLPINVSAGVYIVQINTSEGVLTKKIVIE